MRRRARSGRSPRLLLWARGVDDLVEVEFERGGKVDDREEAGVRGPVLQLPPRVDGQADSACELFVGEVVKAFEPCVAKQCREEFAARREFGWRCRSTGLCHWCSISIPVNKYRNVGKSSRRAGAPVAASMGGAAAPVVLAARRWGVIAVALNRRSGARCWTLGGSLPLSTVKVGVGVPTVQQHDVGQL